VLVTREIIAAGKLLDIDVLDHLWIAHGPTRNDCSG
jgi:DNA repair protein RadC